MPITHVKGLYCPGKDNNYLIAGNICNGFVLGELGAADDFFLVGAEPTEESNSPLLTGNILDSEGNLLFRIVRNVLVFNPALCSRFIGDMVGYEIHDGAGKLIFAVRTTFTDVEGVDGKTWVTTLSGNFYDKQQRLVFAAKQGEEGECLEAHAKHVLGFSGGFGVAIGMNDEERQFAAIALQTRGAIHQIVRGEITENINLEGKALINARVHHCTIQIDRGDFILSGCTIHDCHFAFTGPALNVANAARQAAGLPPLPMLDQPPPPGSGH